MAAVLKKRALAEYSQVIQEDTTVTKKLRLVHKPKSQEPPLSFQGASTPQQILDILLSFENSFPIDSENGEHALRLLQEQFCASKNKAVRAKIASLFGLLSRVSSIDTQQLVNDVIGFLKLEESHKVQSQLLGALCVCGQVALLNTKLHQQIISVASQHLSVESHLVRVKCVQILGALGRPEGEHAHLHTVLAGFILDPDSRVRAAVLQAKLKWHERGVKLDESLYEKAGAALEDDYESVRMTATKLIWVLAQLFPEGKVKLSNETLEENRLIDDGFAKICDMINDSSVRVRAQAAQLLGTLHGVSQKFLEQTLDKKLMSNMRHKKAAHERLKENFESGGWSSGKKWADDAPGEGVDEESVTLMAMGACGAFVHGLEDEFMEVRLASIESVGELATRCESLAMQCQDHLVDMFNDELEAVRLSAINTLRKLGQYVVLREDQLEIIQACLKDFTYEVREALRLLFCTVKLATQGGLNSCIFSLLDNLKRYPQDRMDIYKTMQLLGQHHPYFTLPMVPDLLSSHPYFESIEADVDDPAYVAILVLVFNAAQGCPTIAPLFPDHVLRHYRYLRDTLPELVPLLCVQERVMGLPVLEVESEVGSSNPTSFMEQTLRRLQDIRSMDNADAAQLIEMCVGDLSRVSEMDQALAPNAGFMSTYLQCHLALCKVLSKGQNQLAQTNSFSLLKKVVEHTQRLEQQFLGLAVKDTCEVVQLRLLAQSIQLLQLITSNVASVKQSCVQYLQILNSFERFLSSNNLESRSVAKSLLSEMPKLESCDPAVFYSVLTDAVREYKPCVLSLTSNLRKAKANILEPTENSENVIRFITGLVVAVDLTANLENIDSTGDIRIRIKYADQTVHTVIPRASDFRQVQDSRYRLVTKVLLSHTQWSEPCQVEISIVKCYQKDREFSQEKSLVKMDKKVEAYVELCPPVKVNVAPKSGKY